MADINVERKGPSILPWILGVLALALLAWLLISLFDEEPAVDGALVTDSAAVIATDPVAPRANAVVTRIPVALILADPVPYASQVLEGEVEVAEVPTDRGFWIVDEGQRIFVILNDGPSEQPLDINPGQTLRITAAAVHTDPGTVPGELDADTRAILQGQPAFLVVDESNIQVTGGA